MSPSLNPPRIAPWSWIVLAVLAALGALACASPILTAVRALFWVEGKGRVTQCDVIQDSRGAENLSLRYAYVFDGQNYTGDRFGFVNRPPQKKWAPDYQAGKEVTVFINPQNPHEALLRRDTAVLHWLLPGILAAVAVGLGCGAQRALAQQKIADAATLYTLESALTNRPRFRRRRRRRAA